MNETQPIVRVNVVVEMTTESLQTIVENAKKLAGRNDKGHYRVDTADKVGEMISRFLLAKDFDAYIGDISNYNPPG